MFYTVVFILILKHWGAIRKCVTIFLPPFKWWKVSVYFDNIDKINPHQNAHLFSCGATLSEDASVCLSKFDQDISQEFKVGFR